MASGHDHRPTNYNRAFALGVVLNVGFVVTEMAFGIMADSLALLADAGHNLSDVLGLLLAWGADALSRRQPTKRHTYGWRSSSILAALLNAVILLVAVGGIAWEAIRRFGGPSPVVGQTVIWVAALGVAINTATALLFMAGRRGDLNIRGAFLHMAADAGVSAGVVVAGFAMLFTGWDWLDPAVSLTIAGVILVSTWGLLRDSVALALDAVPREIDPNAVAEYLRGRPGVAGIHDLHIWGMSTTETALTVHLLKPEASGDDSLLAQTTKELQSRFGIEHVTLQWERSDDPRPCDTSCS